MSIINTSTEYYKVQPRSSSERDNSHLLQSALKEASNDMAHRLLNYASLDKMDCEASCILIALANHQENQTTALKQKEQDSQNTMNNVHKEWKRKLDEDKTVVVLPQKRQATKDAVVVQPNHSLKNDPIMLLMAAAEVVERKKRKVSKHKQHGFSRQYYSMKQNPKIKQNALHAYITYMIYNDLAHGSPSKYPNNKKIPWYSSPPGPASQPSLQDKKTSPIISRPLTAFLWNDTAMIEKKDVMILPPIGSKNSQ
ncbi:hypothetical protein BCV71DRAFT_265805 [Rhizopus microsporus]|uniref:Uncharacterized protein n=1 Tax=Rhizopus microsporus TaxID=58291 RepID=A0A1X0RW66_RHIZD|nr:hypothetical protein BCV71DRAFT_265805 [Rhizopus microsporus]